MSLVYALLIGCCKLATPKKYRAPLLHSYLHKYMKNQNKSDAYAPDLDEFARKQAILDRIFRPKKREKRGQLRPSKFLGDFNSV